MGDQPVLVDEAEADERLRERRAAIGDDVLVGLAP
jgi:hypothetical protein